MSRKQSQKKIDKKQNKRKRKHLSAWVWVFVCVAILVFLYCIACNVISNFDDLPKPVKIIFGLSDLANTAIGALLGFGASLLLENYLVSVNKEKVIDNIVAEMTQMCLFILKIFDNKIKTCNALGIINEEVNSKLDSLIISLGKQKYASDYSAEISILEARVINHKYKIYLPIWDSVLQNGDLLRFKGKDYFESLINIYTRLNKFKVQIDSFDSSMREGDKFNYLSGLYSDVQKLKSYIEGHSEYLIDLCDYLKGDNIELKQEFMTCFNLIKN